MDLIIRGATIYDGSGRPGYTGDVGVSGDRIEAVGEVAAGPAGVVALSASGFDLSIAATAMAALLAGIGWLAGVLVTQHPVLLELRRAAEAVAHTSFVRRLRERPMAPGARPEEAR